MTIAILIALRLFQKHPVGSVEDLYVSHYGFSSLRLQGWEPSLGAFLPVGRCREFLIKDFTLSALRYGRWMIPECRQSLPDFYAIACRTHVGRLAGPGLASGRYSLTITKQEGFHAFREK